jgi:hypothetical protein
VFQNGNSFFTEPVIFASLSKKHPVKKLWFILLCIIFSCHVSGQVKFDNTLPQTAIKYYQDREFTKAGPLFKNIYAATGNNYYFRLYIQCLTELQNFEEAESELKKEIRKSKNQYPELYVQYGYILVLQKRTEEARIQYDEAIRITPPNKNSILNTANQFLQVREYEIAEKVYLKGQKALPNEDFTMDLAQVHLLLRNYSQLMIELMDAVRVSEENLTRVQAMLSSALYLDIDNGLREEFRKALLKRIQLEPSVTGYNRLLIWFYLQEKQFPAALRQAIALDRRTGNEYPQILAFAQMALNNNFYADASVAYDYLLSKGKDNPVFFQANYYKVHADYLNFSLNDSRNLTKGQTLANDFDKKLNMLGYSVVTLMLIREYAHLLSFYLDDSEKAKAILEKGLSIPGLKPEQWGELKKELADVYINAGDPWEATLLFSQVIDANRDNPLGDEAKLKKAWLSYYMGNFTWAKVQLEALKASTSKLTANDAMELDLFISNNSGEDSTLTALTYFARADLLFFKNKDSLAILILDSIQSLYSYDLLIDDIFYRKAKIEVRRNNYLKAIELLDEIIKNFSWELLADDALFMKAEIYQYQLNDKTKAAEAYKQILFDYSGSIYVSEARKRYRELTGDAKDKADIPGKNQENLILHGESSPGY